MPEYVCYMLRLASGDSYIGVTGQGLRRRVSQHVREGRIAGKFDVLVLGSSRSRPGINLLEKAMIALYRPTLNRIKGGTSVSGYHHGKPKAIRGPEVYCRRGHELTSGRCMKCRKAYQASYYDTKYRPPWRSRA